MKWASKERPEAVAFRRRVLIVRRKWRMRLK